MPSCCSTQPTTHGLLIPGWDRHCPRDCLPQALPSSGTPMGALPGEGVQLQPGGSANTPLPLDRDSWCPEAGQGLQSCSQLLLQLGSQPLAAGCSPNPIPVPVPISATPQASHTQGPGSCLSAAGSPFPVWPASSWPLAEGAGITALPRPVPGPLESVGRQAPRGKSGLAAGTGLCSVCGVQGCGIPTGSARG